MNTGRRPSPAIWILTAAIVIHAVAFAIFAAQSAQPAGDFDRYYEIGSAVTLVPVLGLFFNRIDAWSTAAAIVAVAGWRRNRPLTLGIALAIGAAFKLWPLVLVPLLIVPWRDRRSVLALVVVLRNAVLVTLAVSAIARLAARPETTA